MKSMTGFGRSSSRTTRKNASGKAVKEEASPDLEISIRAVNGRFLEMRFHLPREYAGLESEFKAILSGHFSRGTIDVYVNRGKSGSGRDAAQILINTNLAQEILQAYRQLGKDLKLKSEINLETIARVPQVLTVEERSELSDKEKKMALKLLADAASACNDERLREGKALQLELGSQCASLESLSAKMESLKGQAQVELQEKYRERVRDAMAKLGLTGAVDDQRLAQEIVMQLDRADISEELSRLKEHLKAYQLLLKSADPQGKKLDFYAQELLREVNTVGSKSHIAALTAVVVEAKTVVEKIREQVQNVE